MTRRRFDHAAYRRNIRKACKSAGVRIPNGYTTDNHEGQFFVRSAGVIIARLGPDEWEPFV